MQGPGWLVRVESRIWERTKQVAPVVYQELFRTRAFTMAAAMSYYFLLSLLPLLIFLSAMLGYLPIPNLFDQLLDLIAVVVPAEAMRMVEQILAGLLSPHRGGWLSFGLLSYLWTASGGFAASIEALNVAYDVTKTRSWLRDRLQAFLLTFTTGLLGLVGLLLIIAGPHFGHFLTDIFAFPQIFAEIWPFLRLSTIFVIFVVAVVTQYYLAPNRKQRFIDTLPGAVVAVGGIFLSSAVMSYYFAHIAHYNRTYGSLGAVIVLMLWFYVVALVFVVGAEINAELLKLQKAEIEELPAAMPAKATGVPAA